MDSVKRTVANPQCLSPLVQTLDQESKKDPIEADSEVLSAMQRFSQGSSGVPVKDRGMCQDRSFSIVDIALT